MPTAVSTVTGEEVQFLIAKLDRAGSFLPVSFPDDLPLRDYSSPRGSRAAAAAPDALPPKHLKQLESLGNHLVAAGLCQPGTTFCEMGCGTAKLSDHVCRMLNGNSSHVLIDRKVFDRKTRLRDGSIAANATLLHSVKRITMDIAQIEDLAAICSDGGDGGASDAAAVVISKHLCGPAADLSIRCSCPGSPMMVATCCHYLCTWDSFCNTAFFERLGFTERDFEVLTIISQWASMGAAQRKNAPAAATESPSNDAATDWWQLVPLPARLPASIAVDNLAESKEFQRSFPRAEKAELGKRCKLFLDVARAYRLHDEGYCVKLVRYTTMSLEDHLLLAKPRK